MKKTLTSAATVRVAFVSLVSLGMLVPMYLLVVNAFKSQQEILANPFSPSFGTATFQYLTDAWNNPDFSILKGYGVTIALVLCVNALAMAVCAPAAYVLARTSKPISRLLLFFFIAGMFIPTQVILVPVIFVLRGIGLMGTLPGLILFMTATTIPFTLFVFFGYIRVLPRSLDEAAAIDGAGRYRTLWRIILPLMRPIVATVFILNSLSVWNDFASPQMILGPGSGVYTVTTGVYAAVGQYSTDYTKVFPTLLLAVIPILVIFVVMQRHIMSGLAAGAVKG
ncbi:transporter [Streptomyces anthocyanicus]|uniref:Carbohydrate ABC transporter permease n=1 Tax=Streptomyces violaceoruber TaxID=1935 RepID=A0ACD4WZ19_STRVN|nr:MULTISPECIES: carbohydrate ABC transporter permease [Streptomyces]WOZ02828.1 carbohydrate ABC transporter permease [Streptomyces violaceoruber]BDD69721.1 transporter [Streptomyces coelicolor]MDX3364493.1 carbohydrate ABC transporter permease [Streptomyces sp. ME02-6987-2C]MDX3397507.1 carbohydrate ABC transporter permease [Streptomyces sp. ME01-18h]MDX3419300.1 carbohydrate ABC transporter permease [Streptomyces sp. ME02-6985-2c]